MGIRLVKLRVCAGLWTWSSAKRTALALQPSRPATNCASRSRTCNAANSAARPFRSVPAEAAVALALGTLSVSLALTLTRVGVRPKTPATMSATLVCRPWPISVPPWLTSTLPSVYTCTNAPAWLNCVAVKLMPNFTGVSASPRCKVGCAAFQAAISARRAR